MTTQCIVLDCETVPDERITKNAEICEHVRDSISAPSNYKDPQKIERYIDDELEKWRNRAALKRWSARIVAIGWSELDSNKTNATVGYRNEGAVLSTFMRAMHEINRRVVLAGYFTRRFDIPLITFRCGVRGIKMPGWWPCAGDYASRQADLCDLFDGEKLSEVAIAHGLPPKLGTGAEVATMTSKQCRAYVKRDVRIERALIRIYRDRFRALREGTPE